MFHKEAVNRPDHVANEGGDVERDPGPGPSPLDLGVQEVNRRPQTARKRAGRISHAETIPCPQIWRGKHGGQIQRGGAANCETKKKHHQNELELVSTTSENLVSASTESTESTEDRPHTYSPWKTVT